MIAEARLPEPKRVQWRASLDRAWRTPAIRRLFEQECGFSPLSPGDQGRANPMARTYESSFLIWATRHLGLESAAPMDIARKARGC